MKRQSEQAVLVVAAALDALGGGPCRVVGDDLLEVEEEVFRGRGCRDIVDALDLRHAFADEELAAVSGDRGDAERFVKQDAGKGIDKLP